MSESTLDFDDEILPVYANHAAVEDSERVSVYRSYLAEYAAEVVAAICTKREEQWELFSHLQPGIILFSFGNHQRVCFSRRGDRLIYKFRTSGVNGRLSSYSFRCLWVVQSPIFQEVLTELSPILDKGSIYLTFSELTDTFIIRVSWTDDPYIPPNSGETLVQVLVEYDNIDPDDPVVPTIEPVNGPTVLSTVEEADESIEDSKGDGNDVDVTTETNPFDTLMSLMSGSSSNQSTASPSPDNSSEVIVQSDVETEFNIL